MKKKKFNQELLKEELNRFKLLNEYDFYQEKKEIPEYKELILGDIDEEDAPEDAKPADDIKSATDKIASDLDIDQTDDTEVSGEIPDEQPADEQPADEPLDEPIAEPSEDEVEVDVTSLVKGSEEAKHSADVASHNTQILLQKFNDLEKRVSSMSNVTAKIDDLEREIIKRNPTPVEKLEMRSLNSYPYTQKLTDYWKDKEGVYDVMDNQNKKKEYVLTKDDVDADYSDVKIKDSFTPKSDDSSYVEEDI